MTTKLSINNLTSETLAWISGPRITSVQITDGNYNVIDDTAANASSIGYILINGNDFDTNPQVLIDTTPVTTLTRVSNSLIRAQIPALNSASFNIQVINSDGSTAILVNGLTYSTFPAWITGSSLTTRESLVPLNIQLSANEASNSAITYSLAAANTLPTGSILYSNGYIQGNVAVNSNTTYNFTIVATDAQNQDVSRAFSLITTLNTPPNWTNQPNILPLAPPLVNYSNTIVAADPAIASYDVTSGSLPPGLTLDSGTGIISGMTAVQNSGNTYSFVVTATDTVGFSATKNINITVGSLFNLVTLLVKTNSVNAANNHSFIDSSTNNYQITRNGNATQGTFSPFSHTGWSNYFGTGYLNIPTNAAFNFGSGDATVDLFVYPTTASQSAGLFDKRANGGSFSQFPQIALDNGVIRAYVSYTGSAWAVDITGPTLSINVWTHIAFVRSGNTWTLYINGSAYTSSTASGSVYTGSDNLTIGASATDGSSPFTGYISNARIVKGTAVYTSNFNPSTQQLTAVSGTSLLTCQSNRFIDNSGNNFTITPNSTYSVQAFSPFAPLTGYDPAVVGGSFFSDGTGDYLSTGADLCGFASGDEFSIEFFAYFNSIPSSFAFIGSTAGTFAYIALYDNANGIYSGKTNEIGSASILKTNPLTLYTKQWYHICFARRSAVMSIYVNGARLATRSSDTTDYTVGSGATIGYNSSASANSVDGYMSQIRVLRGTSAYDTSQTTLTVPTSPLTAITNTKMLISGTNAGIYDASARNVIETVGGVQVSTTQAKFGPTAISFNGTTGYLKIPNNQFYSLNNSTNYTIEFQVYFNNLTGEQILLERFAGGSGPGWTLYLWGSGKIGVFGSAGVFDTPSAVVAAGQWYHMALTRSGSTIYFFVNGVLQLSTTNNVTDNAGPLYIGSRTASSAFLNGYMQDIRITNYTRYTANVAAPTATFTIV